MLLLPFKFKIKEMATVKLTLNRHRCLKSGTYPLVFQLIHQRQKKLIYTSYKLFEEEFDPTMQCVRFVSKNVRSKREVGELNRELRQMLRELNTHISVLEARRSPYSVSDIVVKYDIGHNKLNLLHYMDLKAENKHTLKRFGTESALRHTRASIAEFTGSRIVYISEIDACFVSEYETFLYRRGISPNTVCYYMRNLKSIYRQAKNEGYRVTDTDPFIHVYFKPRKTVKRALKRAELQKIYHADLARSPQLEFARDIFMFSYFCRGMPFVDIIYLKKRNVSNGVIGYFRHKTNQWLQVSLTAQLRKLIDKYDSASPYVFPVLHGEDDWKLHRQYRQMLEYVNRNLKRIGKICGIDTKITTYVARHTWATLAKEMGTPAAIISEGLGHTTEKTTRIYLKEFDHNVVDKVNEQMSML